MSHFFFLQKKFFHEKKKFSPFIQLHQLWSTEKGPTFSSNKHQRNHQKDRDHIIVKQQFPFCKEKKNIQPKKRKQKREAKQQGKTRTNQDSIHKCNIHKTFFSIPTGKNKKLTKMDRKLNNCIQISTNEIPLQMYISQKSGMHMRHLETLKSEESTINI